MASQSLLNPLIRLLRTEDEDTTSKASYIPVSHGFGVDFSMPVLRTGIVMRRKKHIGLMLHRQFVDLCFSDKALVQRFPISDGTVIKSLSYFEKICYYLFHLQVNISNIIPIDNSRKLYKSTLSFLLVKGEVDGRSDIPMCPMEMQSYIYD